MVMRSDGDSSALIIVVCIANGLLIIKFKANLHVLDTVQRTGIILIVLHQQVQKVSGRQMYLILRDRVAAMDGLEVASNLLRSWIILVCAKFNAALPDPPESADEVRHSSGKKFHVS